MVDCMGTYLEPVGEFVAELGNALEAIIVDGDGLGGLEERL